MGGKGQGGQKIRREDELSQNFCVYLLLEKKGSTALGHMSLALWVHLRKGRSWTAIRPATDMEVFRQGGLSLSKKMAVSLRKRQLLELV